MIISARAVQIWTEIVFEILSSVDLEYDHFRQSCLNKRENDLKFKKKVRNSIIEHLIGQMITISDRPSSVDKESTIYFAEIVEIWPENVFEILSSVDQEYYHFYSMFKMDGKLVGNFQKVSENFVIKHLIEQLATA